MHVLPVTAVSLSSTAPGKRFQTSGFRGLGFKGFRVWGVMITSIGGIGGFRPWGLVISMGP